ncbi:SGT1-domain-containing protein [Lophiostoma macrostomum CBS 122681]|uniref:SGT1-domain-containing protein n=1 Tax=Lophiostoma macrostomum CBS 122681 TaxID=1314788 RepID=A0A6A6ST90_9PLEO|nr:SGT1-domain-containing protein [Lophiostoma macrostomum CBS 122681]
MDVTPQDDFKWFGEGFDGFPKKLPEDVVEYIIFILDTRLSDVQTRERLQAFQRALTTLEKRFLTEYIWQRDSIHLELVREMSRWLLKGSTNYGDSVADEWLIVYFLRELSKEFPDAWIRIYDTDGEFLLIQAANALPKWLNPEVAENRVWINSHHLLIIPLSKQEEARPLQLDEALSILSTTPARAQHFPKIESEAFDRLKGYPAAIADNQHHATLPLPRKVAHILHQNPAYIAPAVEAFYLRDPISLRLLQPEKSKRPLFFPPEDFVRVSVRFTKILYAQLLGQNWVPPGPWGAALDKLLDKTSKDPRVTPEKAEIGIKLASGMETLLQHSIYASKPSVRTMHILLSDLSAGDDILPSDADLATWPKREDDEAWLNIDFAEFEKELAGKGAGAGPGFGDKNAQDNLRKMVERFQAFINDEDAGLEGAGGLDPMDVDDDEDEDARRREKRGWEDPEDSDASSERDLNARPGRDSKDGGSEDEDGDEYADAEFAEYEKALEKFMMLSSAEKSALTDDARELAKAEEAEQEEDEEIRKLSEMMEKELFGHGALELNPKADGAKKKRVKSIAGTDTGKGKGKGKARLDDLPEEDDDDDVEYLDEDYNLAENMLQSFKGQVGMAGPAGNLMGLMGLQFPPDADEDEGKSGSRSKGKSKARR